MNKEEQANKIIQNHVLYSMGLGIIPIPLLDIAGVTATQLDMLSQLASVYDRKFSDISGKAFIASIAGALYARIGASMLKIIPGIGSVIGGVSMSIMSGASTYAVGQVVQRFFRDGLDFSDIDVDLAKSIYKEEFEKGKKVANDLNEKKNQNEDPDKSDDLEAHLYDQLAKLGDLKNNGVINEEEFETMKKRIMTKINNLKEE